MKNLLPVFLGLLFLLPRSGLADLDHCLNPKYPYSKYCDESIESADPVMLFNYGMNLGNRNLFVSARLICESGAKGFGDGMNECMSKAKKGNSAAQHYLALLYIRGAGVLQDYEAAYMWSNIAASKGHSPAMEVREYAKAKMGSDQLASASDRSKRCLESQYQDCEKQPLSWFGKITNKLR